MARKRPLLAVALTAWDWQAIRALLSRVGGAPRGNRGAADRLMQELESLDLGAASRAINFEPGRDHIYFKP